VTLPKVVKDTNGNYVLESAHRDITQEQLDFNELNQSLQTITGPQGEAARLAITQNPNISAGVIAGLYKSGSIGTSPLVDTFVQIDQLTQAQRQMDQLKEGQRVSTEKFNNSFWGGAWTGLKGAVRGGFTGALAPVEAGFGMIRRGVKAVSEIPQTVKLTMSGDLDWWTGKPKDPNVKMEDLGLTDYSLGDAINPVKNWEQTVAYQSAKELVTTGKVDLGSGFFASEETGAGFAARQAQLKVGKIAVMRNGEQVLDANGEPLYRPISPIDPISFALTAGHPESQTASVLNAIGEFGLMVYTDPAAAYAKAAREAKILKQAQLTSGAMLTANDAKRLTALETQIADKAEEVQKSMNELLTGRVDGKLSLKTESERRAMYDAAVADQIKLTDEYGSLNLNYDVVAEFLSGEKASHIIDNLTQIDNWQDIWAISRRGGKSGFGVELSKELATAKNRDDVLKALAPYIAGGDVVINSLESGSKASRFLSKITKGDKLNPVNGVGGWAAKGIRKVPGIERAVSGLSKSYNTYIPNSGAFVHFADKDALVQTMVNYGRSTNVPESVISKLIDEVAFAEDASKAGYTASANMFDAIFEANKGRLLKAGIKEEELYDLTRIFESERQKMASYWADRHAAGLDLDYIIKDGTKFTISGSHLDSELLNSMVYFPPAKEIMHEINKVGTLTKITGGKLARTSAFVAKPGSKLSPAADYFTNNLWKKIVLVRPAYVVRNIAEEQIRVMATGHISFFNHPLMAMGMWLGRDNGPKWRQLINSFDHYNNTVFDTRFKMASSAEELSAEAMAHSQIPDYMSFMAHNSIGASKEITKVSALRGFQNVQYGHPKFWEGLANEIRILRESGIARAVANTTPGKEADTVAYLLRGEGKKDYLKFAEAQSPETKSWLLTDEGAMQYLFDGADDAGRQISVKARIEEVAGQGGNASSAIRKLITKGSFETSGYSLTVPQALDSAKNSVKNAEEMSKGKKSLKDVNQDFADVLKKTFEGQGNWDKVLFKVPAAEVKASKFDRKVLTAENFFDHAVQFEKTTTMGPEWRVKYWDAVQSVVLAADKEALASIQKAAPKSLSTLISADGAKMGLKHKYWETVKKADGSGPMSLDDIHNYASKIATKHVSELFYDASKKRLLWHQLRLIAPFGQAWSDTITKWSKLSFQNPGEVYKIGRNLNWLNSPESSGLYNLTDAKDYYDPNQGFFYSDPQSGQKQFFVPFVSTGMNFFTNLFQGKLSTKGAFAAGANPQSFNFALGSGTVLPGVGPGLSIGLNTLDSLDKNPLDILPPAWKDSAYKFVYPFGQPNIGAAGGVEAALLSANMYRIIGGAFKTEDTYSSSFAPVMNYLATSGDYNIDDPEDQTRLVKDTNKFAQYFSIMRGIFGFNTPVAIQPKDLTKDASGNTLLAASLYKDFRDIQQNNGSNINKSYADFLDLYGPEQIFSIISATSGGPNNLATYQMIMRDPSVVDQYKETYGYFYPNGGYSQELYRWQMRTNRRERLTSQEIVQKATNIRYYAAKDRLLTKSVGEGWDSKRTEAALSNLSESYIGIGREVVFDATKEPRILEQLKKATTDERFQDSDAVVGLTDYLYLRDKTLAAAGKDAKGTLKSQGTIAQREFLAKQALEIIKQHPDFQKIYYSFFKKELEG